MSAHLHYMKNAVLKSAATLKHDLDASNAAGEDDGLDPTTVDLRELLMNFDHTPTMVRRVYLQTADSSSLTSVGWVINENMNFCLSCMKSFTFFNRRHHCRACGLLVCAECSPTQPLLKDFHDLGGQRVCGKCNPKSEKVVSLDNNIAWGASVNAHHEMHESTAAANPIVDAADEMAAARAAAEREAAIAHMRLEEDKEKIATALAALSRLPLTIKVVPFPGFVIKTRRVIMDDNKVFINVFHHTSLPDEHMMLTYVPYYPKEVSAELAGTSPSVGSPLDTSPASPVSNSPNGVTTPAAAGPPTIGERMTPIMYIGAQSTTEDKEGYVSLLYNVLVTSDYYSRTTVQGQDVNITHPTSVNKIIQIVNQKFKDTLCEDNFVLPKVKSRYHGNPIMKPIPFTKSEFAVSHVDIKYLYCTGFQGKTDDESVTGRVVTTAQLQAAAAQANAAGKLRRASSGRFTPGAGGSRPNSPGAEDAESIVSDLTLVSNLTDGQQGYVRDSRRFAFYASKKVEGSDVLTEDMLRLNQRKTMSGAYSESIIESSVADPAVLIGYQIMMPYTKEIEAQFGTGGNKLPLVDKSFVYVIIDLAKNNLRQTEYKVSNLLGEDSWVRLKRGKGKSGIEFRVLRKVYFPPDPEKDKEKDGKQASGSEKSAPTPVTADE